MIRKEGYTFFYKKKTPLKLDEIFLTSLLYRAICKNEPSCLKNTFVALSGMVTPRVML